MASNTGSDAANDLWIRVQFLRPIYHGLTEAGPADWPISPLRLVGALMAGAYALDSSVDRTMALEAIRELTRHDPPRQLVPGGKTWSIPPTYAPNTGHGKARHFLDLSMLGLGNSARSAKPQGAKLLSDPRLWFVVPGAGELADGLDRAGPAVPYLGRSMDVCSVTAGRGESAEMGEASRRGTHMWRYPIDASRSPVRGWAANSVDWYELNHEILVSQGDRQPVPPTLYSRALTYREVAAAGDRTVTVLPVMPSSPAKLVASVRRDLADGERPFPSGWAWFPCVRAAYRHADGAAVGVGVAGPRDAPDQVFRAVVERVSRAAGDVPNAPAGSLWTSAEYWTRTASRWVSATPLRAFPDIRVLAYMLEAEIESKTGVKAELVKAERAPLHTWQRRWPQEEDLLDGFTQWWLELSFPSPIGGPLILGSANDRGYGLFAPADTREHAP